MQGKHVWILKFEGPKLSFPEIVCSCTFRPEETPLWSQSSTLGSRLRPALNTAWDALVGTDTMTDQRQLFKWPSAFIYLFLNLCTKMIPSKNIRTWKLVLDFPLGMWTTLNSRTLYWEGKISTNFCGFRPLICGGG